MFWAVFCQIRDRMGGGTQARVVEGADPYRVGSSLGFPWGRAVRDAQRLAEFFFVG